MFQTVPVLAVRGRCRAVWRMPVFGHVGRSVAACAAIAGRAVRVAWARATAKIRPPPRKSAAPMCDPSSAPSKFSAIRRKSALGGMSVVFEPWRQVGQCQVLVAAGCHCRPRSRLPSSRAREQTSGERAAQADRARSRFDRREPVEAGCELHRARATDSRGEVVSK